jgi:hypothetical protein
MRDIVDDTLLRVRKSVVQGMALHIPSKTK